MNRWPTVPFYANPDWNAPTLNALRDFENDKLTRVFNFVYNEIPHIVIKFCIDRGVCKTIQILTVDPAGNYHVTEPPIPESQNHPDRPPTLVELFFFIYPIARNHYQKNQTLDNIQTPLD